MTELAMAAAIRRMIKEAVAAEVSDLKTMINAMTVDVKKDILNLKTSTEELSMRSERNAEMRDAELLRIVRNGLLNDDAQRPAYDAVATEIVMSRIVQRFIQAELAFAVRRGPVAFVTAANESDSVMHEAVRLKVRHDDSDVSARILLLQMCTSEAETALVESLKWL